jgi:Zinc dependent phospholipase C
VAQKAGEELATNRAAAMLGAIGPDLFFFAPDYDPMKLIIRFYRNLEKVLAVFNRVMAPIRTINEKVIEPTEQFVKSLGGDTVKLIEYSLKEVRELAALFKSTLQTAIFTGVITGVDTITDIGFPKASTMFYDKFFTPGVQKNEAISQWYWFDVLHYRQTGEFAQNLVANAKTASARAYAYGYLSHIATDVVGHPFVNQVVGAPYRLNVQRHVTVENFIDCWKFNKDFGESVSATLLTRLGLTKSIPDELAMLMHTAFKKTYTNPRNRPRRVNLDKRGEEGFLTVQEIHDTYDIFFQIMKIMQGMSVARPTEPFSGAAEILDKALSDLLGPFPMPPSAPSKSCGWKDIFGFTKKSKECYSNFFKNIGTYLKYLGTVLTYLFQQVLDLCDLLLTLFLMLPVAALLAILYGIQLMIYEAYRTMHSALALVGFVYPEPDDLRTFNGLSLTTPVLTCDTMRNYPRARDLEESHLICPTGAIESETTVGEMLPASQEVTPDMFIKEREFTIKNVAEYAVCTSPAQTRRLERRGLHLGNATSFTELLVNIAAHPNMPDAYKQLAYTNWNLDSDRGHGYKVWDGKIQPGDVNTTKIANEKFIA